MIASITNSLKELKLSKVFSSCCLVLMLFLSSVNIAQTGSNSNPSITGQLSANGIYNSTNMQSQMQMFTWNIAGNMNAKIYGMDVPFTFSISEQQRSYTQPFNQIGINPKYKWLNIHLGYSHMIFSPYTLSGNTFLGAGVEMKPKNNLRFAAMAGQFQKAVNEIQNSSVNVAPAYRRNGFAAKLGYGTDANHLDLIFLKAKDDVSSLSPNPTKSDALPMDNMVMGINLKSLANKKFILDADVAQTIYHRNLLSDEEQMHRMAVDASTGLKLENATLKFNFKRIEPEFKSLGASYINADIQQYTFQPSFKLLKNKINFSGSVGLQNDNLFNEKTVTTQRLIYSANTALTAGKVYGLNINYSNYGITQQKGTEQLNDTTKISLILSSLSISNRFLITRPKNVQTIVLTNLFQTTNDKNIYTQQFSENQVMTINLAYVFTPLDENALSWNANIMGTKIKTSAGNFLSNGFSIGGNKKMHEGKMETNAQISYAITKFSNYHPGNTINLAAGFIYNLTDHHRFVVGINSIQQIDYSSPNTMNKYYDNRINAGYVYTF